MKSVKSNNPCLAGKQACKSPDWIGTGVIQTSYDIVKAHKGEISVESKPKDGTVFSINLPINQ